MWQATRRWVDWKVWPPLGTTARPCPRPPNRETAEPLADTTDATRVVYMASGDDPSVEPAAEAEVHDDPMVDPTAEQDVTDPVAEQDMAIGGEEGGAEEGVATRGDEGGTGYLLECFRFKRFKVLKVAIAFAG